MAPLSIFSGSGKKGTIDKIKMEDLKVERGQLDIKSRVLYKEICAIIEEKKTVFTEGIGADPLKKQMLALKLTKLENDGQAKLRTFKRVMAQSMVISNLITIKTYQKELKQSPIWIEIEKCDVSELEKILSVANINNENFDAVLEGLTSAFNAGMNLDSQNMSPEATQIMNAWDSIEKGTLSPEAGVEEIAKIKSEINPNLKLNQ